MLKNKNILCISSIDWDFVWQGHQEIMDTFARNGNKVLFIENTGIRVPTISDLPRIKKRLVNWFKSFKGIRKEKENLFVYSPVIWPFPYSGVAAFLNRLIMLPVLKKWMKVADFTAPIILTFLPTRTALDLISNIDNKISVYYCIADFDELVRDRKKLKESEKKILKTVDLVFAQGVALRERCVRYNKNVTIFPFGVRSSLFSGIGASEAGSVPRDLEDVQGIKIGYVGGLHKHIDYKLLEYLAESKPEWKIILVGPDQVNYSVRAKPKNIIMIGMKKYEELPKYIANMDLCVIPYEINEYTKTVYPTKLNEYLYMGKPVVSTGLPEIQEFNRTHKDVVRVADTKEDFLKIVEDALAHNSAMEIAKRKEAAMANSWESRIEEMSGIIDARISEKTISLAANWKENLIKIYHTSKKRVIKVAATFVILYLIIFYSPLVWILAEPLKISDRPAKADAIVVFGGGVGELGSPGKSTIERAGYSVDLYKEGFSKNVIYSSGYQYKYNDAENMKLFALSMGIPKENIFLEKKSNSTYENVKYTTEILNEKKFERIILVSSPYNMRRVALVFGRMAKDITVLYVPVPNPQFYQRERSVKLEQIKAIMHEYLGIVYYYLKGYIRKGEI